MTEQNYEASNAHEALDQNIETQEVQDEESKEMDNHQTEETQHPEVTAAKEEKQQEAAEESTPVCGGFEEATSKLKKALEKSAKDGLAGPVIEYLIGRCKESDSLSADICQKHKTWERCNRYICDQARKTLKGSNGAVKDSVVYEWAEDYFRLDDKATAGKQSEDSTVKTVVKTTTDDTETQKSQNSAPKKKTPKKVDTVKTETAQKDKKPAEKPKLKKNEVEGQLDLFSLINM
jgi:hypothetical protein